MASGALDTTNVRELDVAAFPLSSDHQQRAVRGELESAVAVGDIYLMERDGLPVAYLHLDRQTPGRASVSGLAVHPDAQGVGLGLMMVDHLLSQMRGERLTTAVVTSPRNHVMLNLLFSRGFVARRLCRDFFGPRRHRLWCQMSATAQLADEPTTLVSAIRLDQAFALMEEQQRVVRGLVQTPAGPCFLMSAERPREFLDCVPPAPYGGCN